MTLRAALRILTEHQDPAVRKAGQRMALELKRAPRPVFVVARRDAVGPAQGGQGGDGA